MDFDALREEVEEWVTEGIITDSQAEDILARYDGTDESVEGTDESGDADESRRSRAVLALSLVGAFLVFVGVTLFLATNWGDLPRPARAAILIGAPGLAYAGGFAAYDREASRIGHALCVLGAVLVGPSIFLFEDLFTLGLADAWLLLAWTVVALPTGHVLASRAGTGLGLIVLAALAVELGEPTDPAPILGLLGIVLFVLGQGRSGRSMGIGRVPWTYRVGGATLTLLALLLLTTLEGRFVRFDLEPSAILFAGAVGALVGIGWLHSVGARAGSVWTGATTLALGGSVAVAALAPETVPDLLAFVGTHLGMLAALLATGYVGYRSRSRALIDLAALGGLLQTLSFVAATVVDELSGSIALVVAGLVLLAAGLALERGRRSVLERI